MIARCELLYVAKPIRYAGRPREGGARSRGFQARPGLGSAWPQRGGSGHGLPGRTALYRPGRECRSDPRGRLRDADDDPVARLDLRDAAAPTALSDPGRVAAAVPGLRLRQDAADVTADEMVA